MEDKGIKKLETILFMDIGLCNCGSPSWTIDVIELVLKSQLSSKKIRFINNEIYEKLGTTRYVDGPIQGLIDFVLYILDDKGFLNHGSSIGGAWLTDQGKELLKLLEKHKGDIE